ncbi:MAG: hypothetical protein AUH79_04690 [Betaproteobacteria bacterium 13_1_40CM_4_64_4]|nr:MAG: hypothetical protein AUH79_04690 [Betaproteobacteria bacterium 13_1_40CM_4_64_4]
MIAGRTRAPRSIGAANAPACDVSHDPCHMSCARSNALFLLSLLRKCGRSNEDYPEIEAKEATHRGARRRTMH